VEILTFIGMIVPFLTLIMQEWFSARSRARQANEKYVLDREKFFKFVEGSLVSMRESYRKENGKIGDAEDDIDREMRGR
jgi:hypothetical protein